MRLHDELYTGVLAEYLRDELPFVPHVTLGSFGEDAGRCWQALAEAEQWELDYLSIVDRLDLVKINRERTQITWSREFKL